MNKYQILLIVSSCLLLISCRESYPSIADPNANDVDEVVPSESEADLTPIMPTLSSPQFSFVTRAEGGGTGPFESWEEDREHWLNADFHVFAYQTMNSYGGQVDMTTKSDGQHDKEGAFSTSPCLLYDRIMRISDPEQGSVHFINPASPQENEQNATFFYHLDGQNLKYNFFTFYTDNAKVGSYNHEKDAITCGIKIDGSQDIMHSFAYHDHSDFDKQVNSLSSVLKRDQLNVITASGSYGNLLYSTVAGHRGINPIFRIRHLLSKFNIKVRGGNSESDSPDQDFRNIIITEVYFETLNKGILYVAKDEWGHLENDSAGLSYEKQIAAGELIEWDKNQPDNLYVKIRNYQRNDMANIYEIIKDSLKSQNAPFFHVNDTTLIPLSEKPILLPPLSSYIIHIKGYFINYLNGTHDLNESEPLKKYHLGEEKGVEISLSVPPFHFQPGNDYTINITVYGLQHINIEATILPQWQNGGSIEIDENSLENSRQIKRRNFTKIHKDINNPIINP